jgi:hypothetical protein
MTEPSPEVGVKTISLCGIGPPIILKSLFEQQYRLLVFEYLSIDLCHNKQELPNRMEDLIVLAKCDSN